MIALFLDNLRWRWQEWRARPQVDYVSLRRVRQQETREDW